jgi:hypothetical protein
MGAGMRYQEELQNPYVICFGKPVGKNDLREREREREREM